MQAQNLKQIIFINGLKFSTVLAILVFTGTVFSVQMNTIAYASFWFFKQKLIERFFWAILFIYVCGTGTAFVCANQILFHKKKVIPAGFIWGLAMMILMLCFIPFYLYLHRIVQHNFVIQRMILSFYYKEIFWLVLWSFPPSIAAGTYFAFRIANEAELPEQEAGE